MFISNYILKLSFNVIKGYGSIHASESRDLNALLLQVARGSRSFERCGIDWRLKEARSWGCNLFLFISICVFDVFLRYYNLMRCIWEFEVHMRWGTHLLSDLSVLLVSLSEERFECQFVIQIIYSAFIIYENVNIGLYVIDDLK